MKAKEKPKYNTLTGFFFLPVNKAIEITSTARCSEINIILDLWISTVYNDSQVEGTSIGPVVYIRNGTGSPLVSYNDLSQRWGISKATVGRILRKLEQVKYVSLVTFSGRKGNVIYLQNYLSAMFQISDVMIDMEEVAMVLNIKISLLETDLPTAEETTLEHEVTVSEELASVSKTHIEIVMGKVAKVIDSQGLSCFRCPKSKSATGSAVMFRLIHSTIENGLDLYKYLTGLLKQAKDANLTDVETTRSLLPCNMLEESKGKRK